MNTASTTVCACTVLPKSSVRYFDQMTSYTSAVTPEQKKSNSIIRVFPSLRSAGSLRTAISDYEHGRCQRVRREPGGWLSSASDARGAGWENYVSTGRSL